MSATREEVIREARTWLGTPFQNCGDVKGAGVDCAMLLVRVFCDLGVAPMIDPRPYKPQWFLHSSENRFLQWLGRYAHEVATPQPADIALFNFGKHAAHGAIVIEPGRVILHAYTQAGRVVLDDPGTIAGHLHSYWSAF